MYLLLPLCTYNVRRIINRQNWSFRTYFNRRRFYIITINPDVALLFLRTRQTMSVSETFFLTTVRYMFLPNRYCVKIDFNEVFYGGPQAFTLLNLFQYSGCQLLQLSLVDFAHLLSNWIVVSSNYVSNYKYFTIFAKHSRILLCNSENTIFHNPLQFRS